MQGGTLHSRHFSSSPSVAQMSMIFGFSLVLIISWTDQKSLNVTSMELKWCWSITQSHQQENVNLNYCKKLTNPSLTPCGINVLEALAWKNSISITQQAVDHRCFRKHQGKNLRWAIDAWCPQKQELPGFSEIESAADSWIKWTLCAHWFHLIPVICWFCHERPRCFVIIERPRDTKTVKPRVIWVENRLEVHPRLLTLQPGTGANQVRGDQVKRLQQFQMTHNLPEVPFFQSLRHAHEPRIPTELVSKCQKVDPQISSRAIQNQLKKNGWIQGGALIDVFFERSLESGKHHGLAPCSRQAPTDSTQWHKLLVWLKQQCLRGHDVFIQQHHSLQSRNSEHVLWRGS